MAPAQGQGVQRAVREGQRQLKPTLTSPPLPPRVLVAVLQPLAVPSLVHYWSKPVVHSTGRVVSART